MPVYPDAKVYLVALFLALASGFLFGAVPVRQILSTNPYLVVKAGSDGIIAGHTGRRITFRDILLAVQIAICAVLVTSSLVALRGLERSIHSSFGFDPRNVMLADTDLSMSGYSGDQGPAMQKRMIEALQPIPGVKSVGFISQVPLSGGSSSEDVFTSQATDLTPSKAAANNVAVFSISPDYFRAAGTALITGNGFTWQNSKDAPPVAIVSATFARRIFGSVSNAVGSYYKREDGTRVQVVGVVEDGKYYQLTENPRPAEFLPFLQKPTHLAALLVRSDRDPQQLATEIRSALRGLDSSLPFTIQTWNDGLDLALFPSRVATVALGILGLMGAMLSITGIFGMAAYSVSRRLRELGIRIALGAQHKEILQAALGRAVETPGPWVGRRPRPRPFGHPRPRRRRLFSNAPRSPRPRRSSPCHGPPRPRRHLDSRPARPLRRSPGPPPRRVMPPNRRKKQQQQQQTARFTPQQEACTRSVTCRYNEMPPSPPW